MAIPIDVPQNDPDLQNFVARLFSEVVDLQAYHDASARYEYSQSPAKIPVQPGPNATPDQCWDNCWDMEDAGLGKAVFGWALWITKTNSRPYLWAQHHAVLDRNGILVDVTPRNVREGVADDEIIFVADQRTAFVKGQPRPLPAFLMEIGTSRNGWARFNGSDFDLIPKFQVF